MTCAAYAKWRGVSAMAVSRAIAQGRLPRSSARNAAGVPRILDAALADQEWAQNTDYTDAPHGVRETAARLNAAALAEAELFGSVAAPSGVELETQPHGGALKRTRAQPASGPELPDSPVGVPMSEAAAHEKFWKAKRAQIEFEEEAGNLVLAADVEHEWTDIVRACQTKLLGVPSRVRQRYPELAADVVSGLEDLIREVLSELADESPDGAE